MFQHPVILSGISGRFPKCIRIDELMEALIQNNNLITNDSPRVDPKLFPELPVHNGQVTDWHLFDAQFFGVSEKMANLVDPQTRKTLEVIYEAIADAGLTLNQIRGPRTGVFFGSVHQEIDRHLGLTELSIELPPDASYEKRQEAFGRQQYGRFITQVLNITGPFLDLEGACSTSMTLMVEAFLAICSGQIDTAIVASSNLTLAPHIQCEYERLGLMSNNGACRFLDASGNGYVRSEAVACVILQRGNGPNVKRIQSIIRGAANNTDGYKIDGLTYPSWITQAKLIERCYRLSNIDPRKIQYVEAHGTGTQAGDKMEMKAVDLIFNSKKWPIKNIEELLSENLVNHKESDDQKRSHLLHVGSVKTNLGHAEGVSALASVAKVLTIFTHRIVPASLHFQTPNLNLEPLIAGRIAPIVENLKLKFKFVGLSSFGFGGANAHIIMQDPTTIRFDQNGNPKFINNFNKKKICNEEETDEDYESGEENEANENKNMINSSFMETSNTLFDKLNGHLKTISQYRLIFFCGRSVKAVKFGLQKILSLIKNNQLTEGDAQLIHDFALNQLKYGFNFRGYLLYNSSTKSHEIQVESEPVFNSSTLKDTFKSPAELETKPNTKTENLRNFLDHPNTNSRKLIYLLPGLGYQWNGMGSALASIPFYKQRIFYYCDLIQPYIKFNIVDCLMQVTPSENFNLSESIYCLLGIAIVEMAFVDLLHGLNIQPDACLGHSFGELICAWIDGKITALETLKVTLVLCNLYEPNLIAKQVIPGNMTCHKLPKGAMAVLTCSADQANQLIQTSKISSIYIACDNSDNCVTLSGEYSNLENFLKFVNSKGFSGRMIASCGAAFHSPLVDANYNILLEKLTELIPTKCKRSASWVSTWMDLNSEKEKISWTEGCKKTRSPISIGEYFAKCIFYPVQFRTACKKMASDWKSEAKNDPKPLLLEITTRKFIGVLAKDSLEAELMPGFTAPKPGSEVDVFGFNMKPFLQILGTLYSKGFQVDLSLLYPPQNQKIVLGGSLSISSLIQWDHSIPRLFRTYPKFFNPHMTEKKLTCEDIDCNLIKTEIYKAKKVNDLTCLLSASSILKIVLEHLMKNSKFSNIFDNKIIHLQDVSLFLGNEIQKDVPFEMSILPLINGGTEMSSFKFELRNQRLLIASGIYKTDLEKNDYQIENANTSFDQIKINNFYNQLLTLKYPFINDDHRLASSIQLNENEIWATSNKLNWNQQIELLLQLAIYQNNNIEYDMFETILLSQIQIRLECSKHTHQAYLNNNIKIAKSDSIYINGISLLRRPYLSEQQFQRQIAKTETYLKNYSVLAKKISNQHWSYHLSCMQKEDPKLLKIIALDEPSTTLMDLVTPINQANQTVYISLLSSFITASFMLQKINFLNVRNALIISDDFAFQIAFAWMLSQYEEIDFVIIVQSTPKLNEQIKRQKEILMLISERVKVLHGIQDLNIQLSNLSLPYSSDLIVSDSSDEVVVHESLQCLAPQGQWIFLSSTLCSANKAFGLSILLKNVTLLSVNPLQIWQSFRQVTKNNLIFIELALKNLNSIENVAFMRTLNELSNDQIFQLFNIQLICF